jgi:uncharacterized protein (DUF2384 family)
MAQARRARARKIVTVNPISAESVRSHALETFGSAAKANHWLNRPNQVFQGKTPLEAVESDPQAVEAELTRVDHGVYL